MKILLFWINSSLKSLLSGFMRWISNELYQKEQPIITFLLFFVEIASKLEKVGPTFSSFNPFSSLPSVAKNVRKQIGRHNILLNNKPSRPLFLEFSWGQDTFAPTIELWRPILLIIVIINHYNNNDNNNYYYYYYLLV